MNERHFWTLALILSGAIGVGVLLHLRNADVGAASAGLATPREPPPPEIDVVRMLRTMHLVTVQIDTSIDASSSDESWRGDVSAKVSAPVRYFYGVDLSGLTSSSLTRDPLTGGLSLSVPPPERLAVEVFSGDARTDVQVGGTRLRDVAGEYHLGLARAAMHQRARAAPLAKGDQERLDAVTREQLAELVRVLTGSTSSISVEFATPTTTPGNE